jgi:hypothetical protein
MKVSKKEVVFLSQIDLIECSNNKLKSVFCIDAKDRECGYIGDLFVDGDYVKMHGEEGRGNYNFVKYENKSKIYIITDFDFDEEVEEVINWWLNGCVNECEIQNNWNDWDKVKTGVAYRGGSGYAYSLYAKELI